MTTSEALVRSRSSSSSNNRRNVFTVMRTLAILLITVTFSSQALATNLGSKCQHDMDCTDFIKGSTCSANGYCECAPYFVQYNTTSCLSSQLLGGDCILDDQCTMKVSNSSCLDGACRCVEGYLQFRKHTCLGPAHPGAVCYSHAHCQMFDGRTHCDFLIPNLFGRCQCTAPAKMNAGLCVESSEVIEATENFVLSTTTNSTPRTTAATTTARITTTTTTTTVTPVAVEVPVEEVELAPAESIEEADAVEEQEELIAPAQVTAHMPAVDAADGSAILETTSQQVLTTANIALAEAAAAADIATNAPELATVDDYPYKIEDDYAEENEQQHAAEDETMMAEQLAVAAQATQTDDAENEVSFNLSPTEAEDELMVAGGVADDTMKFDYEDLDGDDNDVPSVGVEQIIEPANEFPAVATNAEQFIEDVVEATESNPNEETHENNISNDVADEDSNNASSGNNMDENESVTNAPHKADAEIPEAIEADVMSEHNEHEQSENSIDKIDSNDADTNKIEADETETVVAEVEEEETLNNLNNNKEDNHFNQLANEYLESATQNVGEQVEDAEQITETPPAAFNVELDEAIKPDAVSVAQHDGQVAVESPVVEDFNEVATEIPVKIANNLDVVNNSETTFQANGDEDAGDESQDKVEVEVSEHEVVASPVNLIGEQQQAAEVLDNAVEESQHTEEALETFSEEQQTTGEAPVQLVEESTQEIPENDFKEIVKEHLEKEVEEGPKESTDIEEKLNEISNIVSEQVEKESAGIIALEDSNETPELVLEEEQKFTAEEQQDEHVIAENIREVLVEPSSLTVAQSVVPLANGEDVSESTTVAAEQLQLESLATVTSDSEQEQIVGSVSEAQIVSAVEQIEADEHVKGTLNKMKEESVSHEVAPEKQETVTEIFTEASYSDVFNSIPHIEQENNNDNIYNTQNQVDENMEFSVEREDAVTEAQETKGYTETPIAIENHVGDIKHEVIEQPAAAVVATATEAVEKIESETVPAELDYTNLESFEKIDNEIFGESINAALSSDTSNIDVHTGQYNVTATEKNLANLHQLEVVTEASIKSPLHEFTENESIADILNDLISAVESTTIRDEDNKHTVADLEADETHIEETSANSVGDLVAEYSHISEEKLNEPAQVGHESPKEVEEHTTELHAADKLITFYPDMQIPANQIKGEMPLAFEENEGSALSSIAEENEEQGLITTERTADLPARTLSPDELPFDMSMDEFYAQELESDNLILETTTNGADASAEVENISESEESSGQGATTASPNDIVEITTQTMLGLASRVTLMEPAAPVSTTLKPLIAEAIIDERESFTPEPARGQENLLTTKPTTEIRKRVELGLEAVSLGLSCHNDKQCQLADPFTVCNARGVCDCARPSQCNAVRTGCSPGTFQCRASGVCISWFFVCDGRADCNDASDEECTSNIRLNQTCPDEAFHCRRSGRCISRAALCDGRKQCPHGEDEVGCSALKTGHCPPHTFRCNSGECLPEYEYCNAIISCRDGSDEPPHMCGSRSMPNFFLKLLNAGGLMSRNDVPGAYCPHKCINGRCRSTAIVCSGRDGCGDGTDEQTCSVCRCPAPATETLPAYFARHRPMPLW